MCVKVCVCVSDLMSLQPALTDGGYISDRENKSCNQLAALSTQQHFGLYMLTFLRSTRSYLPVTTTAWITRVYFIRSLSCDDMRGKDKWRRYSSLSAPGKKRETYVWPLIMWRGATDLVWGETKGCLLVRFVSWLGADFFAKIYCSAAKTQEAHRGSPSPEW